ncbi:hypothetical protein BH11ACT8_BH11ACT8_02090 [soil metagenome]
MTPTPGELLAGVHREICDQVLPHVPKGVVSRQLRAALHTIDQVARTWDRQHAYLAADNADLEDTLDRLAELRGVSRSVPPHADPGPAQGVSDQGLKDALLRNAELQHELEDLQSNCHSTSVPHEVDTELIALHHRMVSRASFAAGVTP